MDKENGTRVGHLRTSHYFEQPFCGLELHWMVPEFPGRHLFERHVAGAADLEQGIARDRIEGLDAAAEQHRQPAEFADVILPIFLGQYYGNDFGSEQRDEKPGDESLQKLHVGLRRWGVKRET
jgi:hypothetical protein